MPKKSAKFTEFWGLSALESFLRIVAFLAISLAPLISLGQDAPPVKESPFASKTYERFSWGVRAGISLSFPHFSDPDAKLSLKSESGLGYVFTGLAQFRIGSYYSFLTEVGYSHKQVRYTYDNGAGENTLNMGFIEFGAGLRRRIKFNLRKNVESELIIHAGPSIEYWLEGSTGQITAGTGPPAEYTVIFNQKADANYNNMYLNGVNRWLWGIDLGIGANAPITPKQKVYVEFRASLGQSNLGTHEGTSDIALIGYQGSPMQLNYLQLNIKSYTFSVYYTFSYNSMDSHVGKSTTDRLVKKKKRPRKRN